MTWLKSAATTLVLVAMAGASHAQVATKKELTLKGARQVIAAATAEARRDNAGGTIAVVDEGGTLIALERLDNTFAASASIAIGKPRTAAIFKRPTRAFEEIIRSGRTPMIALNDFTPLQGGIPIMLDGQVVGAIGVSGAASAQRDEADRYQGKRLNSPNDLVYRSDGSLYFTDPPFGLPGFHNDPRKELPFSGVFRWAAGGLELLDAELSGPNGLAFSPDERYLYVSNWDLTRKVVMRYEVTPGGRLAEGRVFLDVTTAPGEEALDGIKVDQRGNLYVSGPGGLWIVSAEGRHLGTVRGPELPANFAWGDADGKTLYLTARTSLYRIRLGVAGIRP